jgi:hypothetical protein
MGVCSVQRAKNKIKSDLKRASQEKPPLVDTAVSHLKVGQMKEELKARGLECRGLKAVLATRLLDALDGDTLLAAVEGEEENDIEDEE